MIKYLKNIQFFILTLALTLFLSTSFCFAQNAKEVKSNKDQSTKETKLIPKSTPEPVIRTGVIASTENSKALGSVSVGAVTDEQSTFGEKVAISGGVQNNSGKCRATISNAHEEKSFKVRFKVKGTIRGRKALSKSYTGRVKSSGQLVKEFSCKKEAVLQLELLSVKSLN